MTVRYAQPLIPLSTVRILMRMQACEHLDDQSEQCAGQNEAGGILIGRYRGPHVEVAHCTVPGPTDIRTRMSFVRKDPMHERLARWAWRCSGHTLTNVGEWHTHPSGDISPSWRDKQTWREVAIRLSRPAVFVLAVPGSWGLFVQDEQSWQAVRFDVVEYSASGRVFGFAAR